MGIIKKKCLFCGNDFDTSRNNAKYCSNDCRYNSMSTTLNPLRKRRTIKCLECGKDVEVINYTKTKFCSISCSTKHQKRNEDKMSSKVLKTCHHCNKEYYTWNYQKNSKFCSIECKCLNGRVEKECSVCNKSYVSTKWEDDGYCSKKCRNKVSIRRKSKFEKIIYDYLFLKLTDYNVESNTFIKIDNRQMFPDILINKKIVIECFGDYWHCNPEFYNKNYFHKQIRKYSSEIWEYDNEKEKIFKNNGYQVIRIWENDFMKNKITLDEIKNKIYEIHKNNKN